MSDPDVNAEPGRRRRTRGLLTGAVLLAVVLVVVALSGAVSNGDPVGASASTTGDSSASSASSGLTSTTASEVAPIPTTDPEPTPAVPSAVPSAADTRPRRVIIPAIGVDTRIIGLGLQSDGSIEVPQNPDDAGWVEATSPPGNQGPAVVAGHVDSQDGPAVFYRLSELAPGDKITVVRRDGVRERFTVDGSRVYAKNRFPSQDVYGPVPGPALRLITCGGEFDTASGYQDNVVVFAS